MKLRDVRDALADGSVPLSNSLLKAKVLASILRACELREYVDRELRGYSDQEPVPDYRRIPVDSMGTFVNPPHFKPVTDHRVPTLDLPGELREWAETYLCTESVGAIEKLIDTAEQQMIWLPWPHENVAFIPETDIGGYGFRCTDASRCFSTDNLQRVLDNVRNTVLDIVLDLSEQVPDQRDDEQQLATLPPAQVQTIIDTHIHGDFATVAAAGESVQQIVSIVEPRNVESLMAALQQLGVPEAERNRVRIAATEDVQESGDRGKIGPRVRRWFGDLATKAAEKTVETGIATALPHILSALTKFFA